MQYVHRVWSTQSTQTQEILFDRVILQTVALSFKNSIDLIHKMAAKVFMV